MWLDETVLRPVRRRYGEPRVLESSSRSRGRSGTSSSRAAERRRHHDVTLFVLNGERLALIRKPHYTRGTLAAAGRRPARGRELRGRRAAGGARGARGRRSSSIATSSARRRLHVRGERIPWATHVFEATTTAEELAPEDDEEISAARWGTLEELAGPIRERLLATGRALWRYRVLLHDAAAEALAAD